MVQICPINNKDAVYLRDFCTKLRKVSLGDIGGSKWTVVLNNGAGYLFTLCTDEGFEDKIVMKIYDSKHPETNPLGESRYMKNKTYGFEFLCEKSGMYYISIRFRSGEGTKKTCAIGILSFLDKDK